MSSEINGGLVRRQIRTLKGNIVWRMVRPDNPNIVNNNEPAAAPIEAPRAQRRAAVRAQPVDIPVAPEPTVKPKRFYNEAYYGCCGASVYIPEPDETAQKTEADWLRLWNVSGYKGFYESAVKTVDQIKKDIELIESEGLKIVPGHRGNRELYNKLSAASRQYATYELSYLKTNVLEYYSRNLTTYSLENFKKNYKAQTRRYVETPTKSNGVAVSTEQFKNSHQTPAGLWVRDDRPLGGPTEPQKAEDVPPAAKVPEYDVKSGTASASLSVSEPIPGLFTYYNMGVNEVANSIWARIKKENHKAGDIVTFIIVGYQAGKGVLERLSRAGFECVLKTGNRNHPGASILYLFERKLTEEDVA